MGAISRGIERRFISVCVFVAEECEAHASPRANT